MKNNINLDIKSLKPKLKKFGQVLSKHLAFIVAMLVLSAYLFTVWRISQLATAEPTDEASSNAISSTKFPTIDPKAISQIQSLEQNSSQVHSLFNNARNNPFNE